MKSFCFLFLSGILLFAAACNTKPSHIVFNPISDTEFNSPADSTFAPPHGKVWDERKKIHDSCMGISFEANAVFMRSRDTFFAGSIVDMKTMKVVKALDLRQLPGNFFSSVFLFTTKPCYEKKEIDMHVDSFMNNKILLRIDSVNEEINNELNEAMRTSVQTEIETGSWVNMEITDALGKILDTTTNTELMQYKKMLLQPGNMVLARSSSLTDINFYFVTKNILSPALKNKLLSKPSAIGVPVNMQFTYLSNNSFRLSLKGFFQVLGQFMKCREE